VDKLTALAIRSEAKLDQLCAVVGTWPAGEAMVQQLQRESVRDESPEAIAIRDERLRIATEGTGICGFVSRSVANDRRLSDRDADFEARLASIVKVEATSSAMAVVGEAQDAARTGNKKALVTGASVTAAIIALVAAIGGHEGLIRIIQAIK